MGMTMRLTASECGAMKRAIEDLIREGRSYEEAHKLV